MAVSVWYLAGFFSAGATVVGAEVAVCDLLKRLVVFRNPEARRLVFEVVESAINGLSEVVFAAVTLGENLEELRVLTVVDFSSSFGAFKQEKNEINF